MKRLLRPLLFTLEALLLVVALWMALLQVTWLWVQVAPDQVSSWLKWVSGGRVVVARIELPHNLLLPGITLHGLQVKTNAFSLEAGRLAWDIHYADHHLQSHLRLADWRLDMPFASDQAASPLQLQALQSKLTLAFPRWSLPVDALQLDRGLIRAANWQALISTLSIARHGQEVSGSGRVQLVYDRVPVWRGALSLIARLDWRQRIVSGTLEWTMSQPTRLVDLAPLLQTRWRHGVVRLDGALRYRQGQPDLNVVLRLAQLGIHSDDEQGIDSLGAALGWREQAGHRAFVIERWMINDKVLVNQAPAMVVLGSNRFDFFLPHLRLETFKPALTALWPQWDWDNTRFSVDALQLSYQLKPLRLKMLSGEIHALAWPASGNWPGLSLADLVLSGSADQVALTLHQPLQLHWAAWQEKPQAMLTLTHPIQFDRKGRAWVMRPLDFRLDEMSGRVQWRGHSEAGVLDLMLRPKKLAQVKRFLPYGLMDTSLAQWLRQALVKGDVAPIRLHYAGAWRQLFQHDSTLRIETVLNDATLRFQPDWPPLEEMQARLRFRPFRLLVDVASATLKSISVQQAHAEIGPLNGADIALKVSGRARGGAEQVESLVSDSPLVHVLSLETLLGDTLHFSGGQIEADLGLWIPLRGHDHKGMTVDVAARLAGVEAHLPGGLTPKALTGRLDIHYPGTVQGQLQGRLFDKPMSVRVASAEGGERLNFDMKGRAPLSRYLAQARGWLWLDGQLSLPLGEAHGVRFHASGRAQLYENRLPAPLNRLIRQPLRLSGTYASGRLEAALSAGRTTWVEGRWQRLGERFALQQAVVLVGESPAIVRQFRRHPPQKVVISIASEALNLSHWLDWWPDQRRKLPMLASGETLPPMQLALRAKTARYASQRFDQLALTAFTLDPHRLALQVKAHQMDMVGILLPDNHQLVLSARRLALRRPAEGEQVKCTPWQRPGDFKLFFVGSQVTLDSYRLDQLRFNLYGDPAQIRIEGVSARAEGGAVQLDGRMLWRYQENASQLRAHFASNDVKRFLRWAGFKDPGFTGDKADVNAHLVWPGPPDCISLKTLAGRVTFRLDDGVIEQARPGLAKVFAVLSIDSLLRNVKATFGTLKYQGMVYSKIEGEVHIKKGWGHVRRIFLDAPALQAELKGGVDLIRRRFDLKAKVTPQIGGTLTTLLSVFGLANPLTAVGTYLFLKNIPGANPNLVSYHYRIVGPWADPRIINTETGKPITEQNEPKKPEIERIDDLLD